MPPGIHRIPPSQPLHNVTYVSVYGATPAAVTFGYTAGYLGGLVSAGVLVYGSGYYYPPVVVPGRVPAYLPYPYTYAGNVAYNPATGAWARGGTVYGPYGGAATGGTAYNPATGAWARGGAVYGPNGGAGAWSAYNPTTGAYAHGSAAWGPDGGSAQGSFYNPRTGVSGSTSAEQQPLWALGFQHGQRPEPDGEHRKRPECAGPGRGVQSSTGAEGPACAARRQQRRRGAYPERQCLCRRGWQCVPAHRRRLVEMEQWVLEPGAAAEPATLAAARAPSPAPRGSNRRALPVAARAVSRTAPAPPGGTRSSGTTQGRQAEQRPTMTSSQESGGDRAGSGATASANSTTTVRRGSSVRHVSEASAVAAGAAPSPPRAASAGCTTVDAKPPSRCGSGTRRMTTAAGWCCSSRGAATMPHRPRRAAGDY